MQFHVLIYSISLCLFSSSIGLPSLARTGSGLSVSSLTARADEDLNVPDGQRGCDSTNYDPNSLQCRVCGVALGSDPFWCLASNATFDGISKISKHYRHANFTRFTIVRPSPDTVVPIAPSSNRQYAVVQPGKIASLDFRGIPWPWNQTGDARPSFFYGLGTLYNFAYGCADTSGAQAVPCTLSVSAQCANTTDYAWSPGEDANYTAASFDFQYMPKLNHSAPMSLGMWDYNEDLYGSDWYWHASICTNFSFKAAGVGGLPVQLYMDSVTLIQWWGW